ncbi:hypothetical protein IFM89_007981 [Coptis chinensis]|uniref:Uncharacterized protein n=1 Tax=Coptis chinensis TaxID=261450 RepID=A0A835M585_9MAGN|nr:hypothetical protein IFM89_007981 [Coptis chinensis]
MESSFVSERIELAKLCSSRNWSKAIRVLDSLLSRCSITQDICPGSALSCLGKEEEALIVWEQGHGYAVRQSTDLKQLVELEELLARAKQNKPIVSEQHIKESSDPIVSVCDLGTKTHSVSNGSLENGSRSSGTYQVSSISSATSGAISKPDDTSGVIRKLNDTSGVISKSDDTSGAISTPNDTSGVIIKPNDTSGVSSKPKDVSESHKKQTTASEMDKKSSGSSEICIKSIDASAIHMKISDGSKRIQKSNGISKTTSISLDFRLSRGIAWVNEGNYAQAISIFDKILKDNPTYPEALIGRGTAYAFQRELNSAITDFTEAIKSNPSAGEAWKRRGQARAALGESVEARLLHTTLRICGLINYTAIFIWGASLLNRVSDHYSPDFHSSATFKAIEDLTKALEFEPNSPDVLHERGNLVTLLL